MQTNLTLSLPNYRAVYQRDNSNRAMIPVVGVAPVGTLNVTATLVPVNGGTLTVQTIPVDATGQFAANVPTPGGWYSLTVKAENDATVVIDRVGVGEVFALFGHSFLQGGHDKLNQRPANDDRVNTLLDTLTDRTKGFGKLTNMIGPFHDSPDWSASFGDLLVKRLNVPVLIYGCAYGGSNIRQSYELLKGVDRTGLPPGTTDPASRQPFLPLERVMTDYVPKTGIRGLLVEHGYNDRGSSKDTFKEQFRYVMDHVRSTYKKPALSIVLVQEETSTQNFTLADPVTGAAQTELIATYPNTYKGPDFNAPYWPGLHQSTQNDHMFGPSIIQFGTDWDAAITSTYLSTSTPYPAERVADSYLPAVLSNAPVATDIAVIDWVLLSGLGVILIALYIKQSKALIAGFLILLFTILYRFANKS